MEAPLNIVVGDKLLARGEWSRSTVESVYESLKWLESEAQSNADVASIQSSAFAQDDGTPLETQSGGKSNQALRLRTGFDSNVVVPIVRETLWKHAYLVKSHQIQSSMPLMRAMNWSGLFGSYQCLCL